MYKKKGTIEIIYFYLRNIWLGLIGWVQSPKLNINNEL